MVDERMSTAYHEAAHAVAFKTFNIPIDLVELDPAEGWAGCVRWLGGDELHDAEALLIGFYAGASAEFRFNPGADRGVGRIDDEIAATILNTHPELSEVTLRYRADEFVVRHWREIEVVARRLYGAGKLDGGQVAATCFLFGRP